MNNIDSQTIESKFRNDLLAARKTRDALKIEVLQTLITAIDNSTAVPIVGTNNSTEVPRRQVSVSDIKTIIEKEINEIQTTKDIFRKSSHPFPAEFNDRLMLLQTYLGYVGSF